MFPNIRQPYSTIYILLAAWGVVYVLGMITGKFNEDRSRRLPRWSRFGMVALVLAVGGLWWLGAAAGTRISPYSALICLGLLAGAVGDVILGDVLPIKQPVIPAILAFGVGHGFYMAALFTLRRILDVTNSTSLIITVIVSVILSGAAWMVLVRNPKTGRRLNIGSLVYGALLFGVTGIAVDTSLQSRAMLILTAGLILFAISDLILAQPLIRRRGFRSVRDVSFFIYSAGQMMIAFSIGTALALA